jgi:hypothetical protein
VNIDSRLRRLEERAGGRCPECVGGAGIVVAYDEAVATVRREALEECCPRCGRAPTVIRVVYDGDEEGGGYSYWSNARQ